ncbi:17948_t:CDS:2 [Funneliformis geosporum]|uniref:17948_t:CDS:1 n=1 Tax=Funneliformis geosporum TaxID=1117311 RepID=A0A9W4T3F4_9GLOM|nr:17948_t:CDS:2 [Funneliformis geosporum]
MPRNLKTQAQLQAQITQLKQENTHLRTLLRVILDTAHLAINGKEEEKPEQPFSPPSCANCGKATAPNATKKSLLTNYLSGIVKLAKGAQMTKTRIQHLYPLTGTITGRTLKKASPQSKYAGNLFYSLTVNLENQKKTIQVFKDKLTNPQI